ncbi:MAG: hypothetical protein JW984_14425 [Deltaproteobacteria bacterium]|uniref:Carbamoyltransferase domain-containing protein n=1 Tax=Candidatus Zymogenus saltonus TaxID=2844893 RepID=A0A9D8KI38_9DELT|nr:hypothetical protein [Candidatus Zymogenus saltonus]
MITVGINVGHNSTACVFKDGQILAAISEERLTRNVVKANFPISFIRNCFR